MPYECECGRDFVNHRQLWAHRRDEGHAAPERTTWEPPRDMLQRVKEQAKRNLAARLADVVL